MIIICMNSPFGGFDSLYQQIKDALTHPPLFPKISVPAIIATLQEKMYSTVEDVIDETGKVVERTKSYISSINMEVCHLLSHLSEMSFFDLVIKAVKKMLDFVGLSDLLRTFFPKIPGLAISIYDIIVGGVSPKEIYKAIREAIKSGLNVLWEFVPDPFYIDLNIPDISLPHIFQMILKQYKTLIMKPIMDLIGLVTDLIDSLSLGLFSLTLPPMPSVSEIASKLFEKLKVFAIAKGIEIKNIVANQFNSVMGLARTLMDKGLKIVDFLSNLSFSGITDWAFTAIEDLYKTIKMTSVELMMQVNHMIDSLHNLLFKKIWDFITSLPLIGDLIKALFSPFCIPIPTIQDVVGGVESTVQTIQNVVANPIKP